MAERRPNQWTPLGAGFNVILGNDEPDRAQVVFDREHGWMDATDPANRHERWFKPTWFEAVEASQ